MRAERQSRVAKPVNAPLKKDAATGRPAVSPDAATTVALAAKAEHVPMTAARVVVVRMELARRTAAAAKTARAVTVAVATAVAAAIKNRFSPNGIFCSPS